MTLALLLAITFTYTLPSVNASAAGEPLDDLGWVQLVLYRDADTVWTLPVSAVGREGQRDSLTAEVNGDWNAFVRTSDRNQPEPNWSGPSNIQAIVGGSPLAAPTPRSLLRQEYFDLMGRRVRGPTRPGLYWRRDTRVDGSRTQKIVVIRK